MERGIYFDGWFPQQYCYHPSMPPRRLSMLEDLEEMGATILVWAGLGGGSISLPYLEEEAFGEVPARFRQYGFVNDSEFIAHASERDIDLFAIVFEAQAWEFPAEIDAYGNVLAQNELRGTAPATTVGLREFSSDTGPRSWKPFAHYFPNGLRNSRGDMVTNLWEEVASRDLEGEPLHAHWVEVAGQGQKCYFADRNNPVWREYLKAVIRIVIDAGAPGIQLDETDTPMTALRYGGCFCVDCMAVFRAHLLSLPVADLPPELDGVDLASFDYRQWLLARGHRARENPVGLPLYQFYSRSQQLAIARTFRELAGYARSYAASVGRTVRVAGNFYDVAPYYDPMVDDVDVLITEMRETRYQQPWYFRHGVGLARGKPLVAVENPYGGVIPQLADKLVKGRAYDLFRLTIFEASAMGANMSLPYGSWLGTEIRNSYWAPRELVVEIGSFLKRIDHLISSTSPHRTAVLYSVRSMMRTTIDSDQFSDDGRWFDAVDQSDAPPTSYWETVEALSRAGRVFDVIVLPDEGLRDNDINAGTVARYDTLIVPDLWAVSEAQHAAIRDYLDAGGHTVLRGAYGTELTQRPAMEVIGHPHTTVVENLGEVIANTTTEVVAELGESAAVSLHSLADGGTALHVVNYDYDDRADSVRVRRDTRLGIRSTDSFRTATLHKPGFADIALDVDHTGGLWSVIVPELGPYAVIHLQY